MNHSHIKCQEQLKYGVEIKENNKLEWGVCQGITQ